MDIPTIPDQMFALIVLVIVAIVLIIIVAQWRSVSKSKNEIKLLEKEIELKKMSMVEKDIESITTRATRQSFSYQAIHNRSKKSRRIPSFRNQ